MNSSIPSKPILVTAWAAILISSLSMIVLQEIFHYQVSENLNYGLIAAVGIAGLLLTLAWKTVRLLRVFFSLFIVLAGVQWMAFTKIDRLPFVKNLLDNPSFSVSMPAEVILKLAISLVIIAFLFILKKSRHAFFLAKGDIAAPVEEARWIGIKSTETWLTLGRFFSVVLSLGTLAFLVIAGRPPLDIVVKALPFLPAVLFAAALNAFYEEMTYKASFLSVLEDVVGKHQSLWLMAAFFGIWHFYGIPYGVVGVLMATFLGWLLGKSMLETRGLFWAWFLHFLQDVLIFAFLAIGSITPGG
jgi:uncharacterized protein